VYGENGRMNDDTSAELMAAILNVQEAMLFGFERADKKHDELRHDMNRRFDLLLDDIDGRFARVDQRFDLLLDDIDGRFARVDQRFDRMDERFDRLEGRVATIEPRGHRPAS